VTDTPDPANGDHGEHRIVTIKGENGELNEAVTTVEPEGQDRIVQSSPLPASTQRKHPADPVPGTIPRESEESEETPARDG
jgi:hypothetical protein